MRCRLFVLVELWRELEVGGGGGGGKLDSSRYMTIQSAQVIEAMRSVVKLSHSW
jgi:hypothetical protein